MLHNRFRKDVNGEDIYSDIYPTYSAGDGRIRPNNKRSGSAQGIGSFKRKVKCQQCGFLADMNRDDHSGGRQDGNIGTITTTTNTVAVTNGDTYTEYSPDLTISKGSGCPFCGSKNYTKERSKIIDAQKPRPKTGF